MAWFALARVLFVVAVAYAASTLLAGVPWMLVLAVGYLLAARRRSPPQALTP